MTDKIILIIGGDTAPTESNQEYLVDGREGAVFNHVKDVILSADIAIVNLECPLTTCDQQIEKAGPCLKSKPDTINGLINVGINVFSLANNHIMDFGAVGLIETIDQLSKKSIPFTGAGKNIFEARKPLFIERNGYKFAIISIAEHEFSIADENYPGANPVDLFDTPDEIRKVKAEADSVIVLYHGGIENYQFPSPNLQRVCRKLVESGADFVICQHSHCIGSYEEYHGGHIVYGQGNLLFDYKNDEMWQTGLLLKITIHDSKKEIDFIPIIKNGFAIDLADDFMRRKILDSFLIRNNSISDQAYIQQKWLEFTKNRKYRYLQILLGFGGLLRRVDNNLGNLLTKWLCTRSRATHLYNIINCESHLEITRSILKDIC